MRLLSVDDCSVELKTSLRSAYQKLSRAVQSFLLVTTEGRLTGYITRASLERMIFAYGFDGHIDPSLVEECLHRRISGEADDFASLKGRSFGFLPVVENQTGKLISCEYFDRQELKKIGATFVGDGLSPFLIAEVGNNHQGEVSKASEYITQCFAAGFDAVKFQMRNFDHVYKDGYLRSKASHSVEDEYVNNLIEKYSLAPELIIDLIEEHKDKCVFATPFDLCSAKLLVESRAECVKVASADLTFVRLHTLLAESGKTVIVSTGAATVNEIDAVMDIYHRYNNKPILLHCVSNYPPSENLLNLKNITMLKERYEVPVGYSSHDVGVSASAEAVAIGASVIEKHVTFDTQQEGNDHSVSLPVDQWRPFVKDLRSTFNRLGNFERSVNQGEKLTKIALGKSLYAKFEIPEGTLLTLDHFESRSPAKGMSELDLLSFGQLRLKNPLKKGSVLSRDDLVGAAFDEADVSSSFDMHYGVPVRFHDVDAAIQETGVQGVEFHLSENDLISANANSIDQIVPAKLKELKWLAVHCPEQFTGDFVVDFSSHGDDLVRSKTIVINSCRFAEKLAEFTGLDRIPVVVNVGGMTKQEISKSESEKKARLITDNINQLVREHLSAFTRVSLMPQTMPPYPWIFGGSRYHNFLLSKEQISSFCAETGLKITLDTAHSLMHCIDSRIDFSEFLESIGTMVGHVHLGDAIDSRSEGLALGEGLLPLDKVHNYIVANDLSCVTEIWSGHLNNFQGFKRALNTIGAFSPEK